MNQINIDLKNVPNKPGCYLWKDITGEVIYVGKAKRLKSRMKQYFTLNQNPKTSMLVKHITDFEYVLVPSEVDALIVELNLINKYSPKYNIKLKETKTYPYLLLKKYPMLRLEITKNLKKNPGGKYFGPFPEGFGPKKVLKLVESIYPVGKCLKPYSGEECLNYQLGICPGYCIGDVNEEKIDRIYNDVKNFLSGDVNKTIKKIELRINDFSSRKMYEQAKEFYNKLFLVRHYKEKQKSYFNDQKHRDFISYNANDGFISIAISHVRFGKLINTTKIMFKVFDLDYRNAFMQYIINYYNTHLIPHEIILKKEYGFNKYMRANFIIPKKGTKKELLEIANEQSLLKLSEEREELALKIKRREKGIRDLRQLLQLQSLKEIELVDISHFAGKNQLGVVVNFDNFLPEKNKYRKYNLDEENDDYRHIYEVTYRHFRRKLLEKDRLPNLFIVDGKFQIKYAKQALKELNINDVKVIGLFKDGRHNTVGIITEKLEKIKFGENRDLYILLGYMQDEVHRFAIRGQREKSAKDIFK